MKFIICPDGSVVGVYSDNAPYGKLGSVKIERASNVEFNHESQTWEARDLNGYFMCEHEDRQKVLDMEREILEKKLAH